MFFEWRNRNRTMKELRKDQHYTTKELALKLKVEHNEILRIDSVKLKEVQKPLRAKLLPILRGDYMDKLPL